MTYREIKCRKNGTPIDLVPYQLMQKLQAYIGSADVIGDTPTTAA